MLGSHQCSKVMQTHDFIVTRFHSLITGLYFALVFGFVVSLWLLWAIFYVPMQGLHTKIHNFKHVSCLEGSDYWSHSSSHFRCWYRFLPNFSHFLKLHLQIRVCFLNANFLVNGVKHYWPSYPAHYPAIFGCNVGFFYVDRKI